MKPTSRSVPLLILAASLLCAGCGGAPKGDAGLTPVTGTITLDGTPVEKGVVQFISKDGKTVFTGQIERGSYALKANAISPGAKPGDYEVAVQAWEQEPTMDAAGKPVEGKRAVPEKYFSPKSSGLTAKVESSATKVDLPLKK